MIALCNVFPESAENSEIGEVAILVDDSWHRRGIGSMLIGHSEEIAARLGFKQLVAYVLANNVAMKGLLTSRGWNLIPAPDFGPAINAFAKDVQV